MGKSSTIRFTWGPKGECALKYNETNVVYEIPPFSDTDGDGNLEESFEDINPVKVWETIIVDILVLEMPLLVHCLMMVL
jgi:hypothetical protein